MTATPTEYQLKHPAPEGSSGLYYIQDTRSVVGNSVMWWRDGGHGYTCNLDEAGKFDQAEAASIERGRRWQDVAWPVEVIDGLAERHLDGTVVLANMKPGEKFTEQEKQAIAEHVQFWRDRRERKKKQAGKAARK